MVGSRREPCTPLYPGLRASGILVLLAYATEPPDLQAMRQIALDRFRNGVPDARMVPIPGATHVFRGQRSRGGRVALAWLSGLD
jgi:hypothetical protein